MQPEVVAHRGASAYRAEHTVGAYALAIEQGADGLECDVRLSRDGHLVCVHDRTVNRTSTGRGVVSTLTLERLRELDYGSWHPGMPESADDLLTPPDESERGVLTLESLLDLVEAHPGVKLFVETKHPVRYGGLVEAKLIAMLRRYGMARPKDREGSTVVMMSFSALAVRRVRSHTDTLPTVLLLDSLPVNRWDGMLPPYADHTGPGIHLLRADPGYVDRALAHGHETYVWTVDDPADVALCARLGVRFLATNSPAATRAQLNR